MRYVHCKNIHAHIIPLLVIWAHNTQGSKQIPFFECMLMGKLDSTAKRSITLCKIDLSNVKNMLKSVSEISRAAFRPCTEFCSNALCSTLPLAELQTACLGEGTKHSISETGNFWPSLPALQLVPSPAKPPWVFQWPRLNFYFILACCFGIWRTIQMVEMTPLS